MPTPLQFDLPDYQTNETFKQFDSTDALGKAYLDLDTRVKSGGIDLLPEDIRKDPAIARYKSLPELAKGLVETQKMVGGIEKAPEKPEGYKLTSMTGLHANLKAEGIVKSLLPIIHSAGLGNSQADKVQQGLLTTLSTMMVQQEQTKKDNFVKNETTLRGEWGTDFDARMDKLVKTWKSVGGSGNVKETSLDNIKALNKLVGFISEDALKSLGEPAQGPITDATAAQKEIDKYMQEITGKGKSHPYFNDRDPGHEDAKKKMHDLHELLGKK